MKKILLTLMSIVCSLGMTWAGERTVTVDLSKWTVNAGTGGTIDTNTGVAEITLGSTKGNAVTLTSDKTYTSVSKVELSFSASDRGKVSISINAAGETFNSSYANNTLTIGTLSMTKNSTLTTGAVTLSNAADGRVSITIAQASGSNGKTAQLKDVKITYVDNRVISTQVFGGVKIGNTALPTTSYSIADNVITLNDAYILNAPAVKLINHITYTDSSTEDENVEVSNFTVNDEKSYFVGTANIGTTTYTINVPTKSLITETTDVTETTTWDWTKTGATTVQLTDNTYPSKTQEFVLSDLIGNSTNFNSSALKATAEYAVRDGKYYQGSAIKFNTTVAGTVTVRFSNTGKNEARHVVINGSSCDETSATTDVTSSTSLVNPGEVTIVGADTNGDAQYLRIYSIIFTKASSKKESDLNVASSTASVNKNETTTVGFTTTSTGEVTVKSDKEGVATATVNGSNIEITGVGAGEATITVSQEEDDEYQTGEKTITVTVTDPYAPTCYFSADVAATAKVSIPVGAEKQALTSEQATVTGGSLAVSNGQDKAKELITTQNNVYYFAMTNGNTFFTVTLSGDEILKVGDIITSTMSATGRGLKFGTDDTWTGTNPGEASSTTSFSYTVTEGDGICGKSTFNIFRATNNSTYFKDFKVSRPVTVATPAINALGYGTFSCAKNVQITGAKVYKATLSGTTITCTEIESGKVPAGTGVLLYKKGATEASTATALYVDAAEAIEGNDLKATTLADGSLASIESSLALSGSVFKSFNGSAFIGGKAYFPYTSGSNSKSFTIVFDNAETTAVNAIETVNNNNGVVYNLSGQRVNSNAKGIVIMNGKKFINK